MGPQKKKSSVTGEAARERLKGNLDKLRPFTGQLGRLMSKKKK